MNTLVTSRFIYILMGIALILCIPLIAMQFSNEVNWSPFDFLVGFVLLFGLGIAIEVILQKTREYKNKLAWIVIALFVFLLIWAELAVGVFGTPFAGN